VAEVTAAVVAAAATAALATTERRVDGKG
jgi:hypothetical protein